MTLPASIESRIAFEPMSGCWLWLGATSSDGYGSLKWEGRTRSAHLVVYRLLVGPAPEGLEFDHLCRNRPCCSPWHGEWVTHAENCRRGALGEIHGLKTVCSQGHPYDEENTYWRPGGGRGCRKCICQRSQARKRRRRVELLQKEGML